MLHDTADEKAYNIDTMNSKLAQENNEVSD